MTEQKPVTRLLVANRGEIARRVFATCRRLGISTVAVHSDADAHLAFVAEADLAVRLPGSAPADTYLRADLVVEAALRTGADAVHPGYGFLSENAAFARAVLDAGLTWVGPDPASIEQMGSKVAAKELMAAAGVPTLDDLDPSAVTEADLPVLVKASAGGGGRGMRVVRRLEDLPGAVAAAAAEAESAFGDGTVFVEPYVERGRHVEVQVVGTPDGVLVLGDRDCSLQRRHQKVVEEAPAPGLREDVRAAVHDAARRAAAAIDYRGAGTVELLMDSATQRFFFLEMNTRLQVEHPVTEAVHGVDLVALQLAVAEGRPVDLEAPSPRGHAVEVRVYAEDPARDYRPQSGVLERFEVPDVDVELQPQQAYGVRLDSGFTSGDEVGTSYDAMLAKVVSWAPTREEAVRRLTGVLRRARVHGLTTNRDQLLAVLADEVFLAGDMTTTYLDASDLRERRPDRPAHADALAAFAVAVGRTALRAARGGAQHGVAPGWRNVLSQPQRLSLVGAGGDGQDDERVVAWLGPGAGRPPWTFVDPYVEDPDRSWGPATEALVEHAASLGAHPRGGTATVTLGLGGVSHRFEVAERLDADGDGGRYDVDGPYGHVALRVPPRFTDPADQLAEGSLLAPMPATVVRVAVEAGAAVAAGDVVLVLEAMKMQHAVTAPVGGTVTELPVAAGQQVAAGEVLAVVEHHQQDPSQDPSQEDR